MKTWLITGASSGFGYALAEALIRTGDQLILTARNPEKLSSLQQIAPDRVLTLPLDVTQAEQCQHAVEEGLDRFGRIDVLVNNAGYGLLGALEEVSDEQIQQNFETNYFGAVRMMRLVLPIMRQQGAGHIINMSAIAGIANEIGFSIYGATKFALEGTSEALASEVRHLGIKVTIVEPGPFRTAFIEQSLVKGDNFLPDYDRSRGKFQAMLEKLSGQQPGDPQQAAEAIITIANHDKPPLRLVLGQYAYQRIGQKLDAMRKELNDWETVGKNTDYALAKA